MITLRQIARAQSLRTLVLAGTALTLSAGVAFWWYQSSIIPPFTQPVPTPTEAPTAILPSPQMATETVALPSATDKKGASTSTSSLLAPPGMRTYLEVVDSCGSDYSGECVVARSGPGVTYPAVARLREDIVLEVGTSLIVDGQVWHQIVFDEFLRYPERLRSEWYVAGDYVAIFFDPGPLTVWDDGATTTNKRIEVSCGEQRLQAFEGTELVLDIPVSTGLALTPTPRGTYQVYQKVPSRYMQGPLPGLPSDQVYDMPGVPWNLYFTEGGAVIHGTYWHSSFGSRYSHGCVNMPSDAARDLYHWAELGTPVIVR